MQGENADDSDEVGCDDEWTEWISDRKKGWRVVVCVFL